MGIALVSVLVFWLIGTPIIVVGLAFLRVRRSERTRRGLSPDADYPMSTAEAAARNHVGASVRQIGG